jgi:hypothetical protein
MTGAAKPKAHLQLWHAVRTTGGSRRLVGSVFGHPTLENGHRIVTSHLVCIRLVAHQQIQAETLNTIHQLGHVGAPELTHDCRDVLDDILGPGWRPVKLGDQ